MSWQDDPIVSPTPTGSSGGWQDDPIVDQPSMAESAGHALVNNIPGGGQIAAGAKSLPIVGTGKGYSQNLEDWNKQTAIDKAANPISYGAGAVTGAVGSGIAAAAIPGAAEAPLLTSALMGGASMAGNTDVLKHPVEAGAEAAGGAALGAGTSAALGKIAPWLAQKFGGAATSPEAASLAVKNPEMLKNIPSTEDLAQKMPDIVKKMNDQIGEHMDIAKDALSTSKYLNEGAITKDEIADVLGQARKELGGIYTSEGKKAASALQELGVDLSKTHETVSQKQVYDVMQKIDDEIPWDKVHSRPEDVTAEERAMVNVRRGLRDLLGQKNEEFGAMMEPVSILEKDKGDLMGKFGMIRDAEGIRPGDQTVSRLANSLKETEKAAKPESARILGNIKASTGEDLETPLRMQEFKGPTPSNPMGAASRVGAGAAGAAAGHGLGLGGMGLGAVAGQRVLRQPMSVLGRNAASKVIQSLPNIRQAGTQGLTQEIIDYINSKRKQ